MAPRALFAAVAAGATLLVAVVSNASGAAADAFPGCDAFTGLCPKGPRAVSATKRCCSTAFPSACLGGSGHRLDPFRPAFTIGPVVKVATAGAASSDGGHLRHLSVRPSTLDFCRRLCHDMAELGNPNFGKNKVCLVACSEEWYDSSCWTQMGHHTCRRACKKGFWHRRRKRHQCYDRCAAKCTYEW